MSTLLRAIDAAVGCTVCGAPLGGCRCWDDLCSCGHEKPTGQKTCGRTMHEADHAARYCACAAPGTTRRECSKAAGYKNPCRCLCHRGRKASP